MKRQKKKAKNPIKRRVKRRIITLVIAAITVTCVWAINDSGILNKSANNTTSTEIVSDISEVPEYEGSAYVVLNNNEPSFTSKEIMTISYEKYSDLDSLGRCGVAEACIGLDIMPTEERGSIGMVKPSGWHTVKYEGIDNGGHLYNRCHLIAYELAGENANEKNLITGTRQFNTDGMLPFENEVAYYVKETGNHVMYRVTPMFEGDNLVASGVQMEALSVEDDGSGIKFNVYVFNVQDGITIEYATGDSRADK